MNADNFDTVSVDCIVVHYWISMFHGREVIITSENISEYGWGPSPIGNKKDNIIIKAGDSFCNFGDIETYSIYENRITNAKVDIFLLNGKYTIIYTKNITPVQMDFISRNLIKYFVSIGADKNMFSDISDNVDKLIDKMNSSLMLKNLL